MKDAFFIEFVNQRLFFNEVDFVCGSVEEAGIKEGDKVVVVSLPFLFSIFV